MNPRNESGYDPIGDPRTGRPPLPQERERMRRREPEEMDSPDTSARAASFISEDANEQGSMAQTLRDAGEAVSARVGEAASASMERGSELASAASGQIQSYGEDLLGFARRRPLAALLGAAVVGLVIGILSRSRA